MGAHSWANAELAWELGKLMFEYKPDLVITQWPRTNNPEHRTAAYSSFCAFNRYADPRPKELWCYDAYEYHPEWDFGVDVSDYYDRIKQCLEIYEEFTNPDGRNNLVVSRQDQRIEEVGKEVVKSYERFRIAYRSDWKTFSIADEILGKRFAFPTDYCRRLPEGILP